MTNKLLKPSNRLKFYKTLLEMVCKDPSVKGGYCFYLDKVYMLAFKADAWEAFVCAFMSHLPELTYYRPLNKYNGSYWFPQTAKGWEKRIAILEEIISNMEKDLNYYTAVK